MATGKSMKNPMKMNFKASTQDPMYRGKTTPRPRPKNQPKGFRSSPTIGMKNGGRVKGC